MIKIVKKVWAWAYPPIINSLTDIHTNTHIHGMLWNECSFVHKTFIHHIAYHFSRYCTGTYTRKTLSLSFP